MDWVEFAKRREEAPAMTRVPLCADGDALAALEQAQRSTDPAVKATIPQLREKVTEATMVVTLSALGAEEYMALKDTHRPTDPEKAKKGYEWEEDTFAPALIAASIDPPMTPAEAADLWKGVAPKLTAAERTQLFLAARDLNETVPDLGFTVPGTE